MSFDWLRKRLKEQIENGSFNGSYTAPDLSLTNPSPVDTYNPPEVDVPDVPTPTAVPAITPTVNTPAPTVNTTIDKPQIDPKTGANGAKAFDDITTKSPQFGEEGMGHTDLIDAYNAGLNGADMSRETRENAAAGGYLEQLEAMYNAGLQDAKPATGDNTKVNTPSVDNTKVNAPSVDNTKVNMPSVNIPENSVPKDLDNLENLSYTSGNTTGNTSADTTKLSTTSTSNGSSTTAPGATSTMSDEEKELNYMMDMLYINGVTSSGDTSAQMAYEWLSNRDIRIKDQEFVNDIRKIFYGFMERLSSPNSNNDPKVQLAVKYAKDHPNQGQAELKKNISSILNSPLFKDNPNTIENESDANNYIQRNKNNQIVRSLEITGLEGLKNKTKLTDGSYSKEEETVIKEGPYAGCTISQGFNDTTNPKNRGHLGYDIKGDFTAIHPILDGEIVKIQPSQYEYDSNGNRKKDADGNYIIHPDGVTVTVKHINAQGQEFYTTYCHLAEHSVDNLKLGTVTTDSIIGTKGNTGDSDGPHLHVCVYTGAATNNPMGYSSSPKKVFQNIGTSYTANDYYYPPTAYTYDRKFYDLYLVMLTNGDFISLFPYSKRGE